MLVDRNQPVWTTPGKFSVVAILLMYAALASTLLRYGGLQHDAQVYVAQALLRMGESPLTGDLFFRYGSQDDFTLFPGFAAILISAFGIDHGAAILTAAFLVLFFVAAWFLARALVGIAFAWIAVALLIAVPAWYGSAEVFQVAERFLTARLPAVALSLLALTSLLAGRKGWSASLLGLAFVTHPLMALPAAAITMTCMVADRHRLLRQPLLGAGLLAGVLLTGALLGGSSPLMDAIWLSAVRSRSDFLFLESWRIADWQNFVLALVTLYVAAKISEPGLPRRLVVSAMTVAIAGIAATAFTTWGLPIKWVIQSQTWRWVWPATIIAIALLPWVLIELHRRHGPSGSAAAATLACAWVLGSADRSNESAMLMSIALSLACALILGLRGRLPGDDARGWRLAAISVALVAVLWPLAMAASELSFRIDLGGDPYWVQKVVALLRIPALAGLWIALLCLALSRRPARRAATATVIASVALLSAATPEAARSWTNERFGTDVRARFAPWRSVIADQDEVFWPDQLQAIWFVLDRKSYLSVSQLGGIVFSRDTTLEALRRATELAAVFPADMWLGESERKDKDHWAESEAEIQAVCRVPEIVYVVTRRDVGSTFPGIEWPMRGQFAYLYDCRRYSGRRND